jgi:predicted MarR family transcription regulator
LGHIDAKPGQLTYSLRDSKHFDKKNWKNVFYNLSKLQMKLFKSQKNHREITEKITEKSQEESQRNKNF